MEEMAEAPDGGAAKASSAAEKKVPKEELPVLRLDPRETPVHGLGSEKFSIEIHHGGFFLGSGLNVRYLDEKVAWFDNLDRRTFCNGIIDYMISQVGYATGLHLVFWCPPGCSIDQLVEITFAHEVDKMSEASMESKVLVIFLKQELDESDNSDADSSECDFEGDPGWYDSDYDFSKDDELYAENVDESEEDELVKQGKKKCSHAAYVPGYDDVTQADLKLPEQDDSEKRHKSDSDDEEHKKKKKNQKNKIPYKYTPFNPNADMENPQFRLGMVFESVEHLRKAVSNYAVKNRVQIRKKRNNLKRFEAHCEDGCTWKLIGGKDTRTSGFVIKNFVSEHTCEAVQDVKELTAPFLAQQFLEMFRDNENMTLKTFARKVKKKFNMEVSRYKLGRARKEALAVVHGDEIKQFSLLWQYGKEIIARNPRSSFYLHLEHGLFSACYVCLAACKIGWLKGCRPVICIDGTFIKTKYGGQLLTAVGIDGNDAIYPIAMAVVETECYISWSWFLATLKQDLNIVNTSAFTIMSDKQKGLIKGVQEQFPDAEHRFCVRHLYQNIQQVHKGETVRQQLWACAKSTTVQSFDRNMAKLKEDNPGAHAFVDEMAPNTWCRAFFSEFSKCDLLLNNTCEVFNRYILDARELPVMSMFQKIHSQLMHRHHSKRKEASEKWSGYITPKIRDKLKKNADLAAFTEITASGYGVFGVSAFGKDYVVELNMRACSCRRWQLTDIPCSHAIACLKAYRIKSESVVSNCYTLKTYMAAYGGQIFPLRDKDEWEPVEAEPILPPLYEKISGRRKKNIRKHPEESSDGTRLSKHGSIMHCGYCRQPGHRRGKCEKYLEALARENEVAEEAAEGEAHAHQDAHQDAVYEEGETHAHQDAAEPSLHGNNINKGKGPATEMPTSKSSRGRKRKPTTKMREHVQHLMEMARRKKSKQVMDENGDIDYPVLRTHINTNPIAPNLDPEHQEDYMVHILGHEGPSRRVQIVDLVPEESAFVAEHRATIPAARGPQVNTSGRALDTATRARGRGSRGGGSARSSGRGRVAHQAPAHQAADAEASGSTRPKTGRLKWLMFGPAKKSKQVPEAAPADVG